MTRSRNLDIHEDTSSFQRRLFFLDLERARRGERESMDTKPSCLVHRRHRGAFWVATAQASVHAGLRGAAAAGETAPDSRCHIGFTFHGITHMAKVTWQDQRSPEEEAGNP